mgnify:CR=1 FL=1
MVDFKKKIQELKENGITILDGEYNEKQCDDHIQNFEIILNKFKLENKKLNRNCQLIENPYRHDIQLAELIYNKNVDIIFIASPTNTHIKFIEEAMKYKKTIFCESNKNALI